jgi:hypothetical protein
MRLPLFCLFLPSVLSLEKSKGHSFYGDCQEETATASTEKEQSRFFGRIRR